MGHSQAIITEIGSGRVTDYDLTRPRTWPAGQGQGLGLCGEGQGLPDYVQM